MLRDFGFEWPLIGFWMSCNEVERRYNDPGIKLTMVGGLYGKKMLQVLTWKTSTALDWFLRHGTRLTRVEYLEGSGARVMSEHIEKKIIVSLIR